MARGKVHATDQCRMQETVDAINVTFRSLTRSMRVEVSGKDTGGYTVLFAADHGPAVKIAQYPNKRLAHAFLHGLEKSLTLLLAEDLGTGLKMGAVREFFPHERLMCPECGTDLTNVVEWVSCTVTHKKAKCPQCGGLLVQRSISDALVRVFTIKQPELAEAAPE